MKRSEAIEIISEILNSYKNNPSQNHFVVNMVGTNAISNGGGIGINASAIGGGPGSTTIGMQSTVSIDGAKINILQSQALFAVTTNIIDNLNQTLNELQKKIPNKKKIVLIFNELVKIIGNAVVTVVLKHVLKSQGIDV